MILRCYTRVWSIEWALYKFGDIALPTRFPIVVGTLSTVASLAWFGLLTVLGLPFRPIEGLVYFGPPVLVFLGVRRFAVDDMPPVRWMLAVFAERTQRRVRQPGVRLRCRVVHRCG